MSKEYNNNNIKIEEKKFEPDYSYLDKLNKLKYLLAKKAILASMGGIVSSTKEKPIVGTQALDTCYGIMFYNRSNKIAIVGHEVPNSIFVINEILFTISNCLDGNQVWEYLIVSGFRNMNRKDYTKENIIREVILKFRKPNIKLIPFTDISLNAIKLDGRTLSYEFAFDAEIGKFVTEYLFFDKAEHDPRYISSKRNFK